MTTRDVMLAAARAEGERRYRDEAQAQAFAAGAQWHRARGGDFSSPTARETTLGALTAADLGKRVVMDGVDEILGAVLHERLREGGVWVGVETLAVGSIARRWRGSHPPTTPVTVYDE